MRLEDLATSCKLNMASENSNISNIFVIHIIVINMPSSLISQLVVTYYSIYTSPLEKVLRKAEPVIAVKRLYVLCFGELDTVGICNQSEKCNVSNMIAKMCLKKNQHKLSPGGYYANLLSAADQCKVKLSDVYMALCSEVHGSSWSGPGVLVYASKLTKDRNV